MSQTQIITDHAEAIKIVTASFKIPRSTKYNHHYVKSQRKSKASAINLIKKVMVIPGVIFKKSNGGWTATKVRTFSVQATCGRTPIILIYDGKTYKIIGPIGFSDDLQRLREAKTYRPQRREPQAKTVVPIAFKESKRYISDVTWAALFIVVKRRLLFQSIRLGVFLKTLLSLTKKLGSNSRQKMP